MCGVLVICGTQAQRHKSEQIAMCFALLLFGTQEAQRHGANKLLCALVLCMWHAGGTERTRCFMLCIAARWARELANKLLCAECCALVLCGTQGARGHEHKHENEQNDVCFALQLTMGHES